MYIPSVNKYVKYSSYILTPVSSTNKFFLPILSLTTHTSLPHTAVLFYIRVYYLQLTAKHQLEYIREYCRGIGWLSSAATFFIVS